MRKIINIIICLTSFLLITGCSDYDDSDLRNRIDSLKERIQALHAKADLMEAELKDLSYITNGNVISSIQQDSDGKYVITYKDNNDKEHSLVIATNEDVIDVPIVGVGEENGVFFWTTVAGGQTSWLLDETGNKIPVSGHMPDISVSEDGYWMIDGNLLKDPNGNPVEANTDKTSVFKGAEMNADGDLVLTLGDGSVITLPVIGNLNLKLDINPVVHLADLSAITFNYEITGKNTAYTLVDIARADQVTASIDKQTNSITVSFQPGFESGSIIILAYDLNEKTIIKPVYFKKSGNDVIYISSAQQLADFAANVNSGNYAQVATVELTQDIDMKQITDWTPIGNATFLWEKNILTIQGNPFKGIFDGKNFAIRNLSLVSKHTTAGNAYGLFGILDGAIIRNLQIGAPQGDNSHLTVSASVSIDAGVIAGLSNEATIENCTSYVPMTYDGTSPGRVTMGLVGFVFCKEKSSKLENLINYGDINADSQGNTTNGATSIQVGGIAGFSTNDVNSQICNHISYCTNHGQMVSRTARTSGILAAANRYTTFTSCVNKGNQTNSFATKGNGRLGNITCITGTGASMSDCINYGNLISTTSARCGGLVSLANHATNTFDGCANYGEIITDDPNRGVFFAYNNLANTWIGCIASGKVGLYNEGTYLYDDYEAEKNENYLGKQGATKANFSNITYMMGGSGEEGGDTNEATLKILFIGNSFTKDAVEHLPAIIAGADINSIKMVHMYYGGRTIAEYTNGYSSLADYTCYKANAGWSVWGAYAGYTIQDIVKSEDWDIVSIQEHTGKSVAWNWSDTEKNAINGLITKIKSDQARSPKFVYIMSQAYANPEILPEYGQINVLKNNFSSQREMYATIVNQAKKVETECEVDQILATGTLLQNLRTSALNNKMDLTRDGYHMDFGISRYAASCLVFESLISPAFDNKKLDDNKFRYTVKDEGNTTYSTPVTDENRLTALQAARYALSSPFEITSMN